MRYLITYVVIGLIFAILFRNDKDEMVISHPGNTIVFLFVYPFLVWYLAFRIQRFKWKGKIIWERKK